jgi:hypothetical protein
MQLQKVHSSSPVSCMLFKKDFTTFTAPRWISGTRFVLGLVKALCSFVVCAPLLKEFSYTSSVQQLYS